MNRLSRAMAVTAAAALVVPVWAGPAAAESATEVASNAAYFYSAGIDKPDASPAAPPNLTKEADGVAPGKLPVAARAGQRDKISFLQFAFTDVPFDATITKAVLTLPLVPNSPQNVTVAAAPAKVRACLSGPEGFFGEDGAAIALAPAALCDTAAAPAEASPDGKAYVFDVTSIAAAWAQANDGLALVPADGAQTTNFQVVFESMDQAQLAYEYTAPPADDALLDSGTSSSDLGAVADTGTTAFDGGGFGSGSGSVSSPSFDSGSLGGAVASPLVGAELPSGPVPETAVDSPAVAAETRAAPAAVTEQLAPSVGFWVLGLLLAGGLAFLSLVMGDPRTPAATSRAPSRLSLALSSQHRGSAPLLGSRSA